MTNAERARLTFMERGLVRLAKFIKPNTMVWYYPTLNSDDRHAAIVDSDPTELGAGQWVVRLRELDTEYVKKHPAGRTTITAVAVWALEPREP